MHVPFLPPRLWRVPLPNSKGDFASATLRPPKRKPMPLLRTYLTIPPSHRHRFPAFRSVRITAYAAILLPCSLHTPGYHSTIRKAPELPEEGKIHITPRAICLLPSSGNSLHTSCPTTYGIASLRSAMPGGLASCTSALLRHTIPPEYPLPQAPHTFCRHASLWSACLLASSTLLIPLLLPAPGSVIERRQLVKAKGRTLTNCLLPISR